MRVSSFASLGLAVGVSAGAISSHARACCFEITAYGVPGGVIGQLSDGQLRVGQGIAPSNFCTTSNGGLKDQNGRGCILTPPTSQFQCDEGAAPYPGFVVGCNGIVTYNGSAKFVGCPTGDHGGYNIYIQGPAGQGGCVDLTLTSGGSCKATCSSPILRPALARPSPTAVKCSSPVPKLPPLSAPNAGQQNCAPPALKCPGELVGKWEYPHLIVPIDRSRGGTALGVSFNGKVSSVISSVFNFDIPASYAGKTCSLIFLLPQRHQLETSNYKFSGPGNFLFDLVNSTVKETMTFGDVNTNAHLAAVRLFPGSSAVLGTFSCPAGESVAFQMSTYDSTQFEWFQDWNPCPIGLYITAK